MPNTTQVNQRYTKRVNNTNVAGDTWTGMNVPGGGSVAASTINNRGVIKKGGNIPAGRAWTVANQVYANYSPIGVVVYFSDDSVIAKVAGLYTERNVTFKANSSGSFATMTKGAYVIRRVTTTLAGVSNTTLRTGGSDYAIRRSIHKVAASGIRTSFMKGITFLTGGQTVTSLTDGSTKFNDYTIVYSNNSASTGVVPVFTVANAFYQNSATATVPASQTNDVAGNPSLATPGQLVYKAPALLPKLDTYKARLQG